MYYNLTYPMKLGASICTVQRYYENMINFIVKQFIILVIFSLFTHRLMCFTLSIKTYLFLGSVASIANFYLSAKRKNILPLYYRTSRILTSLENTP